MPPRKKRKTATKINSEPQNPFAEEDKVTEATPPLIAEKAKAPVAAHPLDLFEA